MSFDFGLGGDSFDTRGDSFDGRGDSFDGGVTPLNPKALPLSWFHQTEHHG